MKLISARKKKTPINSHLCYSASVLAYNSVTGDKFH